MQRLTIYGSKLLMDFTQNTSIRLLLILRHFYKTREYPATTSLPTFHYAKGNLTLAMSRDMKIQVTSPLLPSSQSLANNPKHPLPRQLQQAAYKQRSCSTNLRRQQTFFVQLLKKLSSTVTSNQLTPLFSSVMASPAKPEILLLSLSMQSWLDESYSSLIDELSSKATLKRAKSASGAITYLSANNPRAIIATDEGLTKSSNASVLQKVLSYVNAGGPADHRPPLPELHSHGCLRQIFQQARPAMETW
jgi:hypothetical protein